MSKNNVFLCAFGSWWAATPFRSGFEACFGSFSLLMAKWALERKLPPKQPHPTSEPRDACDWVSEGAASGSIAMPELPQMPQQFHAPIVPIPRLLEWWLLDDWRRVRTEQGT